MRRPVFGDYTIVHPEFKPVDMRKIKPAGGEFFVWSNGISVFSTSYGSGSGAGRVHLKPRSGEGAGSCDIPGPIRSCRIGVPTTRCGNGFETE